MSTVGHHMKLLEGVTVEPDEDPIDALHDEVRDLREQLRTAQRETATAKRESVRAMGELRRQLGPLYKALQMVFGELDAAGVDDSPAAAPNSRTSAVWESWKNKLGPTAGKAIDALLLHNDLDTQQMAIAIGVSRQHASNIISKLNTTGLINKNGGRVSLKKL